MSGHGEDCASEAPLEPRSYDSPVGGWGSVEGLLRAELQSRARPDALRTLAVQNKPDGYMCSSCAWAKPPQPHAAEFCENGAKATLWDLTSATCGPGFFAEHSVSELAAWSDHALESAGRLTHPLRYDATTDRYVEVGWQEAIADIAARLKAIPPKSATFYTSGKASLEASYLYALFARRYGHNNLPDSSNMCHETTSVALKEYIGSAVGTCTLQDLDHCDAIFYLGQNAGTNSPRILHALKAAVERGCRIVVFNPLRERGLIEFVNPQSPWQMTVGKPTPIAHQYIQLRPGGDIAALTGVCKHLLALHRKDPDRPVLDQAFIAAHTTGSEAVIAFIDRTSWKDIEEASGVTRAELEAAGDVYASAGNVIALYGMGLTQQMHGAQTLGMLVNLLLLRGNIGRPGAGCQSIRGHSNVQGQRTVGISEKPELVPLDRLRELFGFEPPREKGHTTVEFLESLLLGEARAFIGLGGNLARAAPDSARLADAWRRLDLTVHVATRLNHTHLLPGRHAYLLPCLVRAEVDQQASGPQALSVEDSFSHIHASIARARPVSDALKSEVAIVAAIAEATLPWSAHCHWQAWVDDYALIRDLIARTYPDELYDMNTRMHQPGGFYRGNAAHERRWETASGKAQFTPPDTLDATGTAGSGALTLITLRSNDQFNTTVYGHEDRLRGLSGERTIVLMSPDDMRAMGLQDSERVTLETLWDDGIARSVGGLAATPYDLPRGCVVGYFPELNALVPLGHHDVLSKTPAYKGVPVRLVRAGSDQPAATAGRQGTRTSPAAPERAA